MIRVSSKVTRIMVHLHVCNGTDVSTLGSDSLFPDPSGLSQDLTKGMRPIITSCFNFLVNLVNFYGVHQSHGMLLHEHNYTPPQDAFIAFLMIITISGNPITDLEGTLSFSLTKFVQMKNIFLPIQAKMKKLQSKMTTRANKDCVTCARYIEEVKEILMQEI